MTNRSIYDKIIEKGQAEAMEIQKQGVEKARLIEKQRLDEAQNEIRQKLDHVKMKLEDSVKTKKTQTEQQAKQKALQVKKDLMVQSLEVAMNNLKNLSDERLIHYVTKQIEKEELNGNEMLKVSKADIDRYKRLFSSGVEEKEGILLDKLNKQLTKKTYRLVLSKEPASIDGGFLLIGDAFDIDLSFYTVLKETKERYEPELATVLFEEGE